MDAAVATRAVLTAALVAPAPGRGVNDDVLLAEAAAWETIGRVVDARRIAVAAEAEWRSRHQLGAGGLAARLGEKNGTELLSKSLRISSREATHRIAAGKHLAPRISMTGADLPARFPVIAAAVQAGEVGIDSARIIVDLLNVAASRTHPATAEDADAAERELTEHARVESPDILRVHAKTWELLLDPDGAEPSEAEQRRMRTMRLGRARSDGMTRLTGLLPAEEAALVRAGLNAHGRGAQFTFGDTNSAPDTDDGEPCWHEAEADQRTRTQYDFDTFMGIIRAGIRAEQDGSGNSVKTPHEVIVHATIADLERHNGAGWAEDLLVPLSIPTVERLQCSGGTRLLVTGGNGEPLHLGRATRLFTPAQKKAIAARDGGCAWPGCTAPVAWSDAHHIRWYARDHGLTEVENGVLLCSFHHHLAHTTTQWQIRLHERNPYLVPASWQGPPLPRHRMQQHPIVTLMKPHPRT